MTQSGWLFLALSVAISKARSPLPELLLLLSPEDLMAFITVFGGQEVRFPSPDELSENLTHVMYFYHIEAEGHSWEWVAKRYGLDGNRMRSIKAAHKRWRSWVEAEYGDILQFLRGAERVGRG